MIFRRSKPAVQEEAEPEPVDHVTFKGPINGVQPNLGANAKLTQAALIPLKDLVTDAILRRAESVRLDPKGPAMMVRLMVDGVPYPSAKLPKTQGAALVQMAKLLAGLDIKDRKPQSGGMKADHDGVPYEVGVQSAPVPAEQAERMTIRLENLKTRPERPDDLGLGQPLREKIRDLAARKGLLLCCGPPGSGLTATTFGVLRSLDPYTSTIFSMGAVGDRKLIAIMPFEWDRADGLETALTKVHRKEAETVYLDPLRDGETLKKLLAFADQLAIIAEFPAKDTVGGIGQLMQWAGGGEPLAEGLRGLISVKLIRKLCDKCKQVFRPNPKVIEKLGLPPETVSLYRPPKPPAAGTPEAEGFIPCEKCGGLGYFGRTAVFELLEITTGMQAILKGQPTPALIRQQIKTDQMQTFQKEALRLVSEGVTSMEEVQRAFQQPGA